MQSCMLLQWPLVVAACLVAASSTSRQINTCNVGTEYECDCSECWDTVAAMESLDWITVSLIECPLRFNDTMLRKRISNWINEECGAALNCGLKNQLSEKEIVVGHFKCEVDKNELRLVALLNATIGLNQYNVLPAYLLGLVLQSREHLLSFLLHAEILAATVHRRLKGSPLSTTFNIRTAAVVTIAFAIFASFMLLLVYFSQIYVNWSKIVKGEWNQRKYRKVPHVQYSIDKITLNGHICSRNI